MIAERKDGKMIMPLLENPFPNLVDAADAATKMISLQADLFLINQRIKTLKQMKRIVWLAVAFVLINLLLFLSVYWIEYSLFESGWSALTLALTSFLFFGVLGAICIFFAFRSGESSKKI